MMAAAPIRAVPSSTWSKVGAGDISPKYGAWSLPTALGEHEPGLQAERGVARRPEDVWRPSSHR